MTEPKPSKNTHITAPQVLSSAIDEYTFTLSTTLGDWPRVVDEIISHPTIKIARYLSIAPAVIRQWTTDGPAPKEVHDHIAKYITPHRVSIMRDAMLGMIDWGWIAFVGGAVHPEGRPRRRLLPDQPADRGGSRSA